MLSASQTERRLAQLTQELEQLRRAQKSQRLPRAEANLVKITGADVPALSVAGSDETTGSGSAIPYYIDSAGNLQPHKDAAGNNRVVEVRNASSTAATSGEYYPTARMPDGKRLLDLSTSDTNSEATWINFILTGAMTSGVATATVVSISGDAVFDATDGTLGQVVVGSTVNVHDDNNLWADLVVGCTGKAKYRPNASNPLLAEFPVHSSTRPTNKLLATIQDELLASNDSVTINTLGLVLSQDPHIQAPPELQGSPGTLKVANDWGLHGQSDTDVELERVRVGLTISAGTPEEETVYWRVTRALTPFPRKILGTFAADMGTTTSTSEAVNIIKAFGGDYSEATVTGHVYPGWLDTFVAPDGVFGWKKDDGVELEYDQKDNKYYVVRVIGKALRVKGTVYADFLESDLTFEIQNIVGLDGPVDPLVPTITVQNIHGWEGKAGEVIKAEANLTDSTWESYQKNCG